MLIQIQQIEFAGQLKKLDADDNNDVFVLTIFEKIKEITDTQLNKLKSAAKNKTGTILRISKKNFEYEE